MTSKQSNKRNRTTSDDADFKPPAIEKKQKRTSPSDVEPIVSPSRRPSKPKGAPKTSKALQKTWKQWCIEHHWISEQNPGYKQAIGSTEVHKSDAMKYFGLKGWEMDTLPHITFDNTYSLGAPHGRSYNYENVRKLVARKRLFLAGFEESLDLTTLAADFFKRGWELEEDRLRELADKYKKRHDRPRPALRKGYISERHPPPTYPSGLRECACCAFFGISDPYDY